MSSNYKIHGIKIYLPDEHLQNVDIGLYTASGVSWFRWIESEISGTSETYKTGILSSMSSIIEKSTWARTGGVSSVDGINLTIDNTKQFFLELTSADILFHNCKCEIWEFLKDATSGVVTETLIFTGAIQSKSWVESSYNLNVLPPTLKRNANILKTINTDDYPLAEQGVIGSTIPATFGNIYKTDTDDRYAKFVRIQNAETYFKIASDTVFNTALTTVLYQLTDYNVDLQCYPVVGRQLILSGCLKYKIKISDDHTNIVWRNIGVPIYSGRHPLTDLVGHHVIVPVADGDASDAKGCRRSISSAYVNFGHSLLTSNASSGATTAVVADASSFTVGDIVNIIDPTYDHIQYLEITGISGTTLTFRTALDEDYNTAQLSYVDHDTSTITIEVANYFPVDLDGNATANSDNQTWIYITDTALDYRCDHWEIGGYVDTEGAYVTNTDIQLFAYAAKSTAKVTTENTDADIISKPKEFFILPSYAFDYGVGADKSLLSIIGTMTGLDPDTMDSFIIRPLDNIALATELYNIDTIVANQYSRMDDGLFAIGSTAPVSYVYKPPSLVPLSDKKKNVRYAPRVRNTSVHTVGWLWAVEWDLPEYPTTFDPDGVYVGLSMDTTADTNTLGATLSVWWKRYFGDAIGLFNRFTSMNNIGGTRVTWANIPDFYFLVDPLENNSEFFQNRDGSGLSYPDPDNPPNGIVRLNTGYSTYQATELYDKRIYDGAKRAGMYVYMGNAVATYTLDFAQLAMMYRKRVSIGEAVYSAVKGRIYNDTWDSRRVATDVIDNLADFGEHICRLQNFGDTTSIGLTYATSPLINIGRYTIGYTGLTGGVFVVGGTATSVAHPTVTGTIVKNDGATLTLYGAASAGFESGETIIDNTLSVVATTTTVSIVVVGSWDHPTMDSVRDIPIGMQIIGSNNGWTTALKKMFCEHAWCGISTDAYGYESVHYLPKFDGVVSNSITFADVPSHMGIGDVVEPNEKNIYAQPVVKFEYNNATKKCNKVIQILSVQSATFDSSYVVGVTGAVAEELWGRCKTIYDRFKIINEMPSGLANKPLFYDTESAVWWLENFINWQMRKRISVPVYYDKCKTWCNGYHTMLTLPHQTNNVAVECVVEGIEKHKNDGYCIVTLILLDDMPESVFVQDVTYTKTQGANDDIQDVYDTTIDSGTTNKDVQDIT